MIYKIVRSYTEVLCANNSDCDTFCLIPTLFKTLPTIIWLLIFQIEMIQKFTFKLKWITNSYSIFPKVPKILLWKYVFLVYPKTIWISIKIWLISEKGELCRYDIRIQLNCLPEKTFLFKMHMGVVLVCVLDFSFVGWYFVLS